MGAELGKLMSQIMKGKDKVVMALSGGSLPAVLRASLDEMKDEVNWNGVHVFMADERMVPVTHADSNFKACKEALFDHVPIPSDQLYAVKTDLSPEEAAKDYEATLQTVCNGVIDVMLLGMGPDGHTCSLFPSHELLEEKSKLVAHILDSPKPPPQRVTLTLRVCASAGNIIFVCGGAEKKEALRRAIKPTESDNIKETPARIVSEAGKKVSWVVDDGAASLLN
eukprot:TRINITY_DN1129_c0_g1_i1.p1 TRINITY_DN1129_c0_g1~~TRINITY_DN1129_c0_g1_i1.p1  ORF type:complete len:253 (+),score=72.37 TRINITY_DN1129_c0_g1_i1:88-759(+)